ncbi:Tyrosinase [Golovinomyces cichoracearum]|uniref:tyrosinase n=1 Tax=Golovinomyces cichoracearum TaxID=62708 RepID=A0A420IUA5_9PEZI|nr:Tyrosinase [Golovinomyces cichoracearum]
MNLTYCILILIFLSKSILASLHKLYEPSLPSYNYGMVQSAIRIRQNPSFIVTEGASGGRSSDGSLPLRREIRDLEKDEDIWTLYLLGLDRLQNMDQTEKISWYNIAGIHGRPFKSFDGVEPQPGNQNNGYCTHVSILFPTWHRPYLALYEQILYGTIQEIAQRYPAGVMRDRYSAAAVKFRIPYWDWAATRSAGEKILPDSIVQSSGINVNGPNGRQLIANPLYSYRFQPLDPAQLPNNPASYHEAMERQN